MLMLNQAEMEKVYIGNAQETFIVLLEFSSGKATFGYGNNLQARQDNSNPQAQPQSTWATVTIKINESFSPCDDVQVRLTLTKKKEVRIGITAPRHITILRDNAKNLTPKHLR